MKTTKFNAGKFMDWYEESFLLDNSLARKIALNAIKYANKNLELDKFPEFLSAILPDVTEEDVAKFIETEVTNLPEGYKWNHYEDGSGCIMGPNDTKYFSYDLAPYYNAGWVEYKKDSLSSWDIYLDGFDIFKRYAEEQIRLQERKSLKELIMNDYASHDVEFSTAFLDIPANGISMLDAVELYENLQYFINGDHVSFVKGAEVNGTLVTGGIIYGFEQVFSSDDKAPEGFTITEMLIQAQQQADNAGGKLLRFISSDIDGVPEEGAAIIKGEIVDFIF